VPFRRFSPTQVPLNIGREYGTLVIFGELRRTTAERTFPRPSSRRPLTFSRSSARLTISQRRRKNSGEPANAQENIRGLGGRYGRCRSSSRSNNIRAGSIEASPPAVSPPNDRHAIKSTITARTEGRALFGENGPEQTEAVDFGCDNFADYKVTARTRLQTRVLGSALIASIYNRSQEQQQQPSNSNDIWTSCILHLLI